MVGDTLADMGMGRSAKLGANVGVLSGVGKRDELQKHADHLVKFFMNKILYTFLRTVPIKNFQMKFSHKSLLKIF